MRRRASPHWRSCVGPTGSSASGAPGGWLINSRLDRGFSSVPTAAAFGDRRDGLSPRPHAVAQMVCGGMADRARQARRFGSVSGAANWRSDFCPVSCPLAPSSAPPPSPCVLSWNLPRLLWQSEPDPAPTAPPTRRACRSPSQPEGGCENRRARRMQTPGLSEPL